MFALKKLASLMIGLIAGMAIWLLLGPFLEGFTSSRIAIGGLNGVVTLIGGVTANVFAEKLLGIGDKTNV